MPSKWNKLAKKLGGTVVNTAKGVADTYTGGQTSRALDLAGVPETQGIVGGAVDAIAKAPKPEGGMGISQGTHEQVMSDAASAAPMQEAGRMPMRRPGAASGNLSTAFKGAGVAADLAGNLASLKDSEAADKVGGALNEAGGAAGMSADLMNSINQMQTKRAEGAGTPRMRTGHLSEEDEARQRALGEFRARGGSR